MDYKSLIREIPDFPKPGILFYDITTLLKDSQGYRAVIDDLSARYRNDKISKVVGIESRGFILGAPEPSFSPLSLHRPFVLPNEHWL